MRAAAVALAVSLLAGPARADDGLSEDLDRYVRGEYAMNGVFVGVGALNLGAAAWMFADGGDFTRGMAWPFAVVGGVQATVGAVYLALTPGLHRRSRARLRVDREGYRREEGARIEGVVGAFPWFLSVDAALVVAGGVLVSTGYGRGDDLIAGVGVGCLITGAVELVLDAVTLGLARRHRDVLRGWSVGVGPGGVSVGAYY